MKTIKLPSITTIFIIFALLSGSVVALDRWELGCIHFKSKDGE